MIPYRAILTLSTVSDPTQTRALLRDPDGTSGGGLLHFDPSARLTLAEDAYTRALQLCERPDDLHGEANTLRALGDLYVVGALGAQQRELKHRVEAIERACGRDGGEAAAQRPVQQVGVQQPVVLRDWTEERDAPVHEGGRTAGVADGEQARQYVILHQAAVGGPANIALPMRAPAGVRVGAAGSPPHRDACCSTDVPGVGAQLSVAAVGESAGAHRLAEQGSQAGNREVGVVDASARRPVEAAAANDAPGAA